MEGLFISAFLLSLLLPLVLVAFRLRNGEGIFRSAFGTGIKLGFIQFIVSVLLYLPSLLKSPEACLGEACAWDGVGMIIAALLIPVFVVVLLIFAGIYRLIFKSQHNNTKASTQDK